MSFYPDRAGSAVNVPMKITAAARSRLAMRFMRLSLKVEQKQLNSTPGWLLFRCSEGPALEALGIQTVCQSHVERRR